MTTSLDELAMRREADAIAARRADAIQRHPVTVSKRCPSHAAMLHHIASLITTEDLPPARVTITSAAEVLVDATGEAQVENTVRRWAAAMEQPVKDTAAEVNGWAATQWFASGYRDGVWFQVTGTQLHPAPVVDRFGVGLVSS